MSDIRDTTDDKEGFPKPKTGWFTRNFAAGSDMDFEGFEEAREKWRQHDMLTRNDRLEELPE